MANRKSGGQQIEDLSHVEFETSEDVEILSTFDTMHLNEDLVRGIYSYGKYLNLPPVNLLGVTCMFQ